MWSCIPHINLLCFVVTQFLSRIYALFWRTFYRPKKYGGVPKMTNMRYASGCRTPFSAMRRSARWWLFIVFLFFYTHSLTATSDRETKETKHIKAIFPFRQQRNPYPSATLLSRLGLSISLRICNATLWHFNPRNNHRYIYSYQRVALLMDRDTDSSANAWAQTA